MFGSSYLIKPSWYEFLIWTPASKYLHLTTFSNICVWFYPCSYICDCLKMPKKSQINEYSDAMFSMMYSQVLRTTLACSQRDVPKVSNILTIIIVHVLPSVCSFPLTCSRLSNGMISCSLGILSPGKFPICSQWVLMLPANIKCFPLNSLHVGFSKVPNFIISCF
jgi:hypothetical protein